MHYSYPVKVGLVGTGFLSRGIQLLLAEQKDVTCSIILTRRETENIIPHDKRTEVTNSVEDFCERCEIIVECSGGIDHVASVVKTSHDQGKAVITLNSEFQVTKGSDYTDTGILIEGRGDQPGCMAALDHELKGMGFKPVVYGNMKGFLNHCPSKEEMLYWSQKQGISERQVVAATDGTKLQIEQCLIANGLGATILKPGMVGYVTSDLKEGAAALAKMASGLDRPIVDYLLSDPNSKSKLPSGIFVVATTSDDHLPFMSYYKMGEGPYYLFHRPYYLPHLEVIKTIREVTSGSFIEFNNGPNPDFDIYAIAKRKLKKGEFLSYGSGSYDVRGEVDFVERNNSCIPIGKIEEFQIPRNVEKGEKF